MARILETMRDSAIDRRRFLQASAAVGALAAASLAGCSSTGEPAGEPTEGGEEEPEGGSTGTGYQGVLPEGGEWITFNCTTATCAYRCHNQAYVKDGIILRAGTGNTHEDSPDYPQCRPCIKGMSTRRIVTGVERLKYPIKRKNWQPGGGENAHGELRGRDEWERISWDEALDLIAGEILRIIDTYGTRAFFCLAACPSASAITTSAA